MAFLEFAHFLWEATKPTIVPTDNKSVTQIIQTKANPPALWKACDHVLHFNLKIAHIARSINTAAYFFSKLDFKVTEKIRLKIREPIQTKPIELTTSFSDVADAKHVLFNQTDNESESENESSNGKNHRGIMQWNG